jgi:hypothetical protein
MYISLWLNNLTKFQGCINRECEQGVAIVFNFIFIMRRVSRDNENYQILIFDTYSLTIRSKFFYMKNFHTTNGNITGQIILYVI